MHHRFNLLAVLAATWSVGTAVASTAAALRKTPALADLTLGLWVGLGLLAVLGAARAVSGWRTLRWRATIPLAVALSGLALSEIGSQAGVLARNSRFRHALPYYEEVVDRVATGALPIDKQIPIDSLPLRIRSCCYAVRGWRDSTNALVVEFLTDRGTRYLNGWVYYARDSVGPESQLTRRSTRGYRVAPHWYRVSF